MPEQSRRAGADEQELKAVLLVEQDADLRHLLAEFLNRAGFIVVPAYSGEGAMLLCEKLAIDVILLDLPAPNPAALALVQALKKANPRAVLIVLMVQPTENAVREYSTAGADHLIGRPIEGLKALERQLRSALQRRDAGRDRRREGGAAAVRPPD